VYRADNVLLFIQIFAGNVVLGNLVCANFFFVCIVGILYARDYARFESISFLDQLIDAFRIRSFAVGQALQIARLTARIARGALPRYGRDVDQLIVVPELSLVGGFDRFADDGLFGNRSRF
jgi:hypothetical protein